MISGEMILNIEFSEKRFNNYNLMFNKRAYSKI